MDYVPEVGLLIGEQELVLSALGERRVWPGRSSPIVHLPGSNAGTPVSPVAPELGVRNRDERPWLNQEASRWNQEIRDERYVAAAKALYNEEGTLEIDDCAQVSRSVEGAYVQAWVWVSEPDVQCE